MTAGRLVIRADANSVIGSGHVQRTMAIGDAWRRRGGELVIVTCGPRTSLPAAIRDNENVEWLTVGHPDPADLRAVIDVIRRWPGALVLLDGYGFDDGYRRVIVEHGARLIIMDDTGTNASHAHMVVNANPGADAGWYVGLSAELLLGPRFAPLRMEFRCHQRRRPRPQAAEPHVLVTLGGSDRRNRTPLVLDALRLVGRRLVVRVVVGPTNARRSEIVGACETMTHDVCCVADPTDMALLMDWADVAISASGGTLAELAFMGVPSVSVITADNQRDAAECLAAVGVTTTLGPADAVTPEQIAGALTQLLDHTDLQAKQSAAGQALIDGDGADRIVAAMWLLAGAR